MPSGGRDGMVVVGVRAGLGEHELQLARVVAPGGEQAALGHRRRRVLAPADHGRDGGEPLPQRGRGVQQEQVDVASRGERVEDPEVARGQAREAEEREPRRQVEQPGLLAQPRARPLEPLRRARHADPRPQAPPQLRLPVARRAAGRPGEHQRGPVQGVAVEQPGQVPHAAEPPRAPRAKR